jgi:hypothetical protein
VDPAALTLDGPGVSRDQAGVSSMTAGQQYVAVCRYADDGSIAYANEFTYNPAAPGSPAGVGLDVAAIARQVYDQLPLTLPQPHTAPPPDAQLVGFATWLWVDGSVWRDFETSVSLAGITVTVAASPKTTRWDLGDGTIKSCGAGTAWAPGSGNDRSDCQHVYRFVSARRNGGVYDARVTVVWSVRWSASTGQGGTLPDASRSTAFSMDVGERQAVITYGS